MTAPSLAILLASETAALTLAGRSVRDHALDRLAGVAVEAVPIGASAPRDGDPGAAVDAVARVIAERGLGQEACFYLLDGDVAWFDGPEAALARLAEGFDAGRFDGMLLLARVTELDASVEPEGLALDPLGIVRRPEELEIAPFVFAGVQLLSTRLFAGTAAADIGALWDRAIARGRLGGLVHDGVWFKLATARDVDAAEQSFEDRMAGTRL